MMMLHELFDICATCLFSYNKHCGPNLLIAFINVTQIVCNDLFENLGKLSYVCLHHEEFMKLVGKHGIHHQYSFDEGDGLILCH
jgi:hypothetical protein